MQVGLKPKLNANIGRPTQSKPSLDNTTEAPKTYIPEHLKQNLSSPSPPTPSSQNDASHLTPNSCLDKPELHEEQPTQLNTRHTSSSALKRKITDRELEAFSKRLRKAVSSPKPVFFDPDTATLISQSRLESFKLSERQKAEDEEHTRKFVS